MHSKAKREVRVTFFCTLTVSPDEVVAAITVLFASLAFWGGLIFLPRQNQEKDQ